MNPSLPRPRARYADREVDMTTIKTGYRQLGRGKSSRGLTRVRYVGTIAIRENGQYISSYTGNVHRITPEDAIADAGIAAQDIISQNPGVAITVE